MRYEDLRPSLQTGDLVLFSSNDKPGPQLGEIIKAVTGGAFNHVGMIFREGDLVLLTESNTPRGPDVDTGKLVFGCQTTDFRSIVRGYDGLIVVRHLNWPPDWGQTQIESSKKAMREFRLEMAGTPYERRLDEFVKSALDVPSWLDFDFLRRFHSNEESARSWDFVFCSEYMAGFYHRGLLLDLAMPAPECVPMDFAQGHKIDGLLRCGATLTPGTLCEW